VVSNRTLSGNSAYYYGGGAYYGTLKNCFVYYNWAPHGPNWFSAFPYFNYNDCTTPLLPGPGNFTDAPRFVDTNGWSDLRLQADSPCIDGGTNLSGLISTDILGLPRPMDGNGDGLARFDIGAYEFNPYRFEPTLHLSGDGF